MVSPCFWSPVPCYPLTRLLLYTGHQAAPALRSLHLWAACLDGPSFPEIRTVHSASSGLCAQGTPTAASLVALCNTAVLGLLHSLRHAPRAYCHWPANNVFSEHSSSPLECKLPESRGFVKYAHRLGHNKWPVNICLVDECFLKKGRLIFL